MLSEQLLQHLLILLLTVSELLHLGRELSVEFSVLGLSPCLIRLGRLLVAHQLSLKLGDVLLDLMLKRINRLLGQIDDLIDAARPAV